MSQSQQPTYRHARRVVQLCGELSELEPMSRAWKQHLLRSLITIVPAKLAVLAELTDFRSGAKAQLRSAEAFGWLEPAGQRDFSQWAATGDYERDHPCMGRTMADRRASFTHRRVEVVDDRTWRNSPMYRQHLTISRLDDNINSVQRLDSRGWVVSLSVYREMGERSGFTPRERAILHLLRSGLTPTFMAHGARERRCESLTPRMREVLERLLAGDSEKQIARRLHRSYHTIHEYVIKLYRHFGVSTRAELLALCLSRGAGAQPAISASRRIGIVPALGRRHLPAGR